MTDFMKSYCDSNNSEHQIILYKEMEEFNKHFGSNTHTTVRNRVYHFLPPGASTDTSDDTKEIERRPNKRIYASSTNLLPDFRSQVPKWRRPYPALADDYTEAGPSRHAPNK